MMRCRIGWRTYAAVALGLVATLLRDASDVVYGLAVYIARDD